ncbi:MAG: xylan 1,4-beta-xylosidase [Oscillospiraceae bacterium]|nr:xylan 1,4-beta-xylosidase [Oscillospiraceae bacterium]
MARKEDRFVKILVDNGGFSESNMAIYVDRQTGVNYLFAQSGYSGGLCVLVDAQGKPIITPPSQLMEE